MSLDLAVRRLSPHKRRPVQPALLSPDEASLVLGQPVWWIANLHAVKIGKRVWRYRATDLGLKPPRATDVTVAQLAKRWSVSDGVVKRMISASQLRIRSPFDKPLIVTADSIRAREKPPRPTTRALPKQK